MRSLHAERKETLMGLLDWFFGRNEELRTQHAATTYGPGGGAQQLSETDEQALQRYR
jgi:hypothetical protein